MRYRRPLIRSLLLSGALVPCVGAAVLVPSAVAGAHANPPAASATGFQPTVFGAAGFSDSAEGSFLNLLNAHRASIGVGRLTTDGNLTSYARGHAQYQAMVNTLHHSNISVLLGPFSVVGENVGIGSDVGTIHQAFLASPTHYYNLADPIFTHVGIGVFVDGAGRTWTTHIFGRR